jgi:hypothetical protein
VLATGVELVVIAGLTALLCWLFSILDGHFPDLFPLRVSIDVILFLLAFSITMFYTQKQYASYQHAAQKAHWLCNTVLHAKDRELITSDKARNFITVLKTAFLSAPNFSIAAAARDIDSILPEATALEVSLHELEDIHLKILSQIAVYLWAFMLPWTLWGYFWRLSIAIVPLLLLPLLALRQFACHFRYKARAANQTDSKWNQALQKLDWTLEQLK